MGVTSCWRTTRPAKFRLLLFCFATRPCAAGTKKLQPDWPRNTIGQTSSGVSRKSCSGSQADFQLASRTICALPDSHEYPGTGWKSESGCRQREVPGACRPYGLRWRSCIVVEGELVTRLFRRISVSFAQKLHRCFCWRTCCIRAREARYAPPANDRTHHAAFVG